MNRKAKIQPPHSNSPEAGNCKLQMIRAPTGTQKGRNPGSRTSGEVTLPLAERSKDPRGQGGSRPAAHSSARDSPTWQPYTGEDSDWPCLPGRHARHARACTLHHHWDTSVSSERWTPWPLPSSHSESSFVGPLTLLGHRGCLCHMPDLGRKLSFTAVCCYLWASVRFTGPD